jgi:hypothetical protein
VRAIWLPASMMRRTSSGASIGGSATPSLRTSACEIATSLVGPLPRLRLPSGAEAPAGVGAASAVGSSVGRAA